MRTTSILQFSSPEDFDSNHDHQSASIKALRAKFIDLLAHKMNSCIESNLNGLCHYFPDYEHVNHLYLDPKTKTSGSILHFAITTNNPKLLRILQKFNPSTDIKNSMGLTPLELAYKEDNENLISALVTTLPLCCDDASVIHFAAATNDLKLLACVIESEGFIQFIYNDKNGEYPLEIALKNSNLRVAEYLMRNSFYCPKERIKAIYLDCLSRKHHVAIHILEYNKDFMYLPNSTGLDAMLLAALRGNEIVIHNLFYLGYEKVKAPYNLEEKLLELSASEDIIKVMKSFK